MALTRLNNRSVSSVTALPSGIDIPTGVIVRADLPVGTIIQAVQVNDATLYTTSSTSSYTTIVSANITPTSSSNKIMIICGTGEIDISSGWGNARIFRSSTEIASLCSEFGRGLANTAETHYGGVGITYIDSPSTTSSITYSVGIKCNASGTFRVGNGSKSYITLLEIVG